jgi:hypothetical protein
MEEVVALDAAAKTVTVECGRDVRAAGAVSA